MPELITTVRRKSIKIIDLGNDCKMNISLRTRLIKAKSNADRDAAFNTRTISCTEVYLKEI